MKNIKAVLFDFDDTLQDRTAAYKKFSSAFLDKYFPTLPKDEKAKRRKMMEENIKGGYCERSLYFSELIWEWKWMDPPTISELIEVYHTMFPEYTTLFEDTVPTLRELKKRGYLLGVITNGVSKLQNKKLDVAGIRKYFDFVLVSGDCKYAKPDKKIFELAARELSLPTGEIAFVGDHPVNDIAGAQSAGMKTIWMNYGYFKGQRPDGAVQINCMRDLLNILK